MTGQGFNAHAFLTVAEVAQQLRVSKMTIYRMIHAGELPALKVGKSFRVPSAAAEQLVAQALEGWDENRATGS